MKKLIVVVLVLLLVSMVTYGEELWRRVGAGDEIAPKEGIIYVGIGTTNPGKELEVNGDIKIPLNKRIYFRNASIQGYSDYYDGLKFYTGPTNIPRMTITPGGQIGIGTTNPGSYKLNVNGNVFSNGTITFPTVTYGGTESITALKFPQTSDGVEIISQQLEDDKSELIIKMKDNTHTDAFKLWFDDYRGESYDRYPLEVRGDRVLLAQNGGYVGVGYVGTSGPEKHLDVRGEIQSKSINPLIRFYDTDSESEYDRQYIIGRDGYLLVQAYDGNNWTSTMKLKTTLQYFPGNVGIGTTNPGSYKLAVNGAILAKEIKVETDWSDFVFADDYELMSLNKLEEHVKVNRSLPGIPTEKEVLENGVNLGEMQAKLLEKVEELTLYVIDQDKELTKLKKEVENLKEENEKLKKNN